MSFHNSLDISHKIIRETVCPGDFVVDGTMGKGNDTNLLAELVGPTGKVYGFDIQPAAVEATQAKLQKNGYLERAELFLKGHEHIKDMVPKGISAAMFNLGYLPGGDHGIFTMAETTKAALEGCMEKLRVGGIISMVVYYGGDSGYEEKNDVMEYIKTIDYKRFSVLKCSWENQPNDPPIAVIIEKIKE